MTTTLTDQDFTLNYDIRFVDVVEIERQARILRARIVADGIRSAWAWAVARLRRAPGEQTA